jgi:hypothetical protein
VPRGRRNGATSALHIHVKGSKKTATLISVAALTEDPNAGYSGCR